MLIALLVLDAIALADVFLPAVRRRLDASSNAGARLDASSPTSTSQNGWPASADPRSIDIITVAVPLSGGRRLNIQVARKAALALVEMIQWWDRMVEPVKTLGSYHYRNIRGSSTVTSNHGSGTAIDINEAQHPLAAEGTVPAAFRQLISDKATSLGLRWGGDYRHRQDEMHIELRGGFVAQARHTFNDWAVAPPLGA